MSEKDYSNTIMDYIEALSRFNCSLTRYPNGINRLAFTSAESDAIDWAKKNWRVTVTHVTMTHF